MTRELFRKDAYLRDCDATVTALHDLAIEVDQTVFYPLGGGQPGDVGNMRLADGRSLKIVDCYKDRKSSAHLHVLEAGVVMPAIGDKVRLSIHWERRYRLMRMHSCLHMLCAVIPAPVTGGSLSDGRGRLDFDLADPIDKELVNQQLNLLISEDAPMQMSWISEAELEDNPDLVRTLSVQPPRGQGDIRLIEFMGVDKQPCGGTHVASSGEIGKIKIQKVEKKGRHNRRIIIEFDD